MREGDCSGRIRNCGDEPPLLTISLGRERGLARIANPQGGNDAPHLGIKVFSLATQWHVRLVNSGLYDLREFDEI